MEELEDLGAKFSRDKTFCFDRIIIHEIIFDDTHDVTLYCSVPYFGKMFGANFGLTFDQLNTLLRSTRAAGATVAAALAEKLDGEIEIPSVIELEQVYGNALEINNCILYTTLYDISSDEDDETEDEDEDSLSGMPGFSGEEDEDELEDEEDEDEDGLEAYAFLIDEILPKNSLN
jgi:hypothetical protein